MDIHKNARLTPHGRERMVKMILAGQTPEAASEAAGVCPRTARKWRDRGSQLVAASDAQADGAGGLATATWTLVASDVGLDGSAGGAYHHYDLLRGGTVMASIAADADILRV